MQISMAVYDTPNINVVQLSLQWKVLLSGTVVIPEISGNMLKKVIHTSIIIFQIITINNVIPFKENNIPPNS